jgi:hypothetical protein
MQTGWAAASFLNCNLLFKPGQTQYTMLPRIKRGLSPIYYALSVC